MTHRSVFALSLVFVLAGANSASPTLAAEDRVVAIGDIHGSYDGIVSILRARQNGSWLSKIMPMRRQSASKTPPPE